MVDPWTMTVLWGLTVDPDVCVELRMLEDCVDPLATMVVSELSVEYADPRLLDMLVDPSGRIMV